MQNLIEKLNFFVKKPKVIMIFGENRAKVKDFLTKILKLNFKIGEKVLIVDIDLKNPESLEKLNFFVKNSPFPILSFLSDSFSSGQAEEIQGIMQNLPDSARIILDSDDESLKELKLREDIPVTTFASRVPADLRVTDIFETNFKVSYKGSTIPIWFEKPMDLSSKEIDPEVRNVLAAVSIGLMLNLNIVGISQVLRA